MRFGTSLGSDGIKSRLLGVLSVLSESENLRLELWGGAGATGAVNRQDRTGWRRAGTATGTGADPVATHGAALARNLACSRVFIISAGAGNS